VSAAAYRLADPLHLWLLTVPADPVLIGELNLVRESRGVSLRYADAWLDRGFALSEDLPLIDEEFLPHEKETAAGAVDDARPDRWGERVIRFLDKPPRLSLLDYLYFAGDDRFGALGVSTSAAEYRPRRLGPLPTLRDVARIQELIRSLQNGEPVPEAERRLLAPGATMGGARPKALLDIDAAQWIVKFGDGDATDSPLIEHATMTLAQRAGIHTAETMPVPLEAGHAVAIKRFDRHGVRRIHCLTAHVALRAAAEPFGYPDLAQLLRRRGATAADRNLSDMHELFRRMVFNILIDNTDDHEKNHALFVTDGQQYELAPAYDVLPTGQSLGFQQMRVGELEADSTLTNALSMAQLFDLSKQQAVAQIRRVARVVSDWRQHFAHCGVVQRDIALLAEQIDRSFLADQRREYA
jgi:serine/threonine-protein kinase HipA